MTAQPETLTNAFFVNMLDMDIESTVSTAEHVYEGRDRQTGNVKWTRTAVDLIFGSHSQLRAIAEVYAPTTRRPSSAKTSSRQWDNVMNLDPFERLMSTMVTT